MPSSYRTFSFLSFSVLLCVCVLKYEWKFLNVDSESPRYVWALGDETREGLYCVPVSGMSINIVSIKGDNQVQFFSCRNGTKYKTKPAGVYLCCLALYAFARCALTATKPAYASHHIGSL